MKKLRWVLYVLMLLVCLGVGVGLRIADEAAESLTGGGNILKLWEGVNNPRGQFPGRTTLNILVVGMDYNRDHYGQIRPHGQRSDTIMILMADLQSGKLRALSIPRDTYVDAPDGVSGKINGTFSRGGVRLLIQTLNSLLGVNIDHFVVVKPSAVKEIVDAVGGVWVETIDEMRYEDEAGELSIDLPKGRQFVDGHKAEGFVRFREVQKYRRDGRRIVRVRGTKPSKEEGDIRRTARQQQLIQALVEAGLQPKNWSRAPNIIEQGFSQIITDLSRMQILALATVVRQTGSQSLTSLTLPGKDAMRDGAYYWDLDMERSMAIVDWLIYGDDSAMRRLVRVQIKNGSKVKGAARQAAVLIEGLGYRTTVAGNAKETPNTTILYGKSAYQQAAEEIETALQVDVAQKSPVPSNDWEPDVSIVIGDDIASRFAEP